MTDLFHTQIRAAIADLNLQAALDKNAEMRLTARASAYDTIEDLQALRQRAHSIRAAVIDDHERYLAEFTANAQAGGFKVHRANNAAQARQIVLEIAQEHGVRRVAKSKTMVSEEIQLNHALESAGIQTVETDLGEYIVQLRGEAPSHIITPAVHLLREDVGETFHQKLGIPLTNDIPTMTDAARAALRQTFLQADMGLSGVNFGVAEGGAIAIVTNEGNGRMVTTLPKVHVALMGIERLVPRYEDLALVLKLLTRAATGQLISVYVQILSGPRRVEELDGALERHIVLVDNGRSSVRGTLLNDTLFCIRCGACLNACPVFREIGGYTYASVDGDYTPYPGPIGSALSPALFSHADFGHLAQASTLCGACKEACPMDIDLPTLLLRVRAGKVEVGGENEPGGEAGIGLPGVVRWGLRAFTWFASAPGRFAFAQKMAGIFSRLWSPRAAWMKLPAFTGWGYAKDFPRPAVNTFRDRWLRSEQSMAGSDPSPVARVDPPAENQEPANGDLEAQSPQSTTKTSPMEQFQCELETLGGVFVRCNVDELADKILVILKEKGVNTAAAWDDAHLPDGLLTTLREQGVHIQQEPDPEIKVGITGALAGIAETGTLVLTSGAGQPQCASLLNECHIAVLREDDLKENLAQALGLRKVQEAAAASLISGPSKTADIEMTLTVGVHGPGEVIVFCI